MHHGVDEFFVCFFLQSKICIRRSRPHLSLITFRGHMAVHGLFDFLLEACGTAIGGGSASGGRSSRGGGRGGVARGLDVPLLLSRQPFLNASLKALKVSPQYLQLAPACRTREVIRTVKLVPSESDGLVVQFGGLHLFRCCLLFFKDTCSRGRAKFKR